MRERSSTTPSFSVDVALFSALNGELALLLRRSSARDKWVLPWAWPRERESLRQAATRLARSEAGAPAAWLEQAGAFGDGKRHPSSAALSVAFAGVMPPVPRAPAGAEQAWLAIHDLPPLPLRQRTEVDEAVSVVRLRTTWAPIAFKLLPPLFTLGELQQTYELLLGKRLHKASFRRSLQSAALVEPTDEWRSEGRGRPAQLYRYAPRQRRPAQRGIHLDLLDPL